MADAETLLNLEQDEVAVAEFLAENGGHLATELSSTLFTARPKPQATP